MVIAVVGVNRVGKTHFLASSLTLAYRERALAAIGCTEFVPDDSTSQRFMMDYFYPLFRRGELLSVTAAEDDEVRFKPLIFNVVMDGVAFSLIMHDIAGEVLGDHRKRARAATYLRAARGIIFVVDPRDIDSLRTGLPEWILDSNEIAFDQGALLAECLRSDGILAEREPVPVAVTIAKADLIPEACGEVPGFLMRPSPVESESELIDRIKAHGREVVEFLDRHGAHNILGPAHEYDRRVSSNGGSTRARVTYHAVSALGSAPDLNEELVDRVEPLNCVDPLAAILLQIARS